MNNIFDRVTRLVSGSLSGLMDKVEQSAPETVLTGYIVEVDEAIGKTESAIRRLDEAAEFHKAELKRNQDRHQTLEGQVKDAIAQDNNDLAIVGIATILELESKQPLLEQVVNESEQQKQQLKEQLALLKDRKEKLLKTFNDLREQPDQAVTIDPEMSQPVTGSNESLLEKLLKALDFYADEQKPKAENVSELEQLAKLSRERRIRQRLEEMKEEKEPQHE